MVSHLMGLALFFLFVRPGENFRLTCTVLLDASSTAGSIVRGRSMRGHRSNKSTITIIVVDLRTSKKMLEQMDK